MAARMDIRGAGGTFTSGWGAGDTIEIRINVTSDADTSGIEITKSGLADLQGATKITATTTMDFSRANRENTETLQERIAPLRSASWDFMLMGRALSVLNNYFFNHNEVLKLVTATVYGVGAAMRIVVTAVDLFRIAQELGLIGDAQKVISNEALATSYTHVASAAWAATAAETAAAAAGGVAGAVATYAPIVSTIAYLQKGGVVTKTGLALVHKGETVIPEGMNIYNFTTANTNTFMQKEMPSPLTVGNPPIYKNEVFPSSNTTTNTSTMIANMYNYKNEVVPPMGVNVYTQKSEPIIQTPAGTNLNNINITLNTGPVSSTVDIDNMMDTVAWRMAQEARRRGGR
jgi:hypothetical protein